MSAQLQELKPPTIDLLHQADNYLSNGLKNPETLHMNVQVAKALLMRVLARMELKERHDDEL